VSRNVVLYAGLLAWAGVIVDTVFHIAIGDPIIPAVFGMIILGWVALRAPQLAVRKATATFS
jgi:hypothetical protein